MLEDIKKTPQNTFLASHGNEYELPRSSGLRDFNERINQALEYSKWPHFKKDFYDTEHKILVVILKVFKTGGRVALRIILAVAAFVAFGVYKANVSIKNRFQKISY